MLKKLFFNWKMNPTSPNEASSLFAEFVSLAQSQPQISLVVLPPYVYLSELNQQLQTSGVTNLKLGAQDLARHSAGAYTGQISGQMLKNMGCQYVLIGHSETREAYQLSHQQINQKLLQSLESGLVPILCVGHQSDKTITEINYPELSEQVTTALQNLPTECQTGFYLAYEPVWAIGTGKTATNSIIEEVSQFLKQELAKLGLAKQVGILYGGSVDDVSIQELVKLQQVDGFLIGGASLKPEKFKTIAQVVANQV